MGAKIRNRLGRLRPVVALNNVWRGARLRWHRDRLRDLGVKKPWFGLLKHADVAGKGKGVARLDRPDGLDELRSDPHFQGLPEDLQESLIAWPERGYLVAEGFFDRDLVARLNDELDGLMDAGTIREHHLSPRFMDVHRHAEAAGEITDDPRLAEMVELILGRPGWLFQTIAFIRGSQQNAHSDAFHMMTEPPGFLVGVWVALEDIDEGSGPVFYLPGSHRLPYVMTEDLDVEPGSALLVPDKNDAYVRRIREVADDAGTEPERFVARAGDVLFWHHNLLHGGTGITREGATRRSLVAHYFGEDVLCYHEVTERPVQRAIA